MAVLTDKERQEIRGTKVQEGKMVAKMAESEGWGIVKKAISEHKVYLMREVIDKLAVGHTKEAEALSNHLKGIQWVEETIKGFVDKGTRARKAK